MLIVAVPALSKVTAEVYPPPVIFAAPVGVGVPLPPLTTTVTVSPWVIEMPYEDGVTVTEGVTKATVTLEEVPAEPL
jgi:hypothetical protein